MAEPSSNGDLASDSQLTPDGSTGHNELDDPGQATQNYRPVGCGVSENVGGVVTPP